MSRVDRVETDRWKWLQAIASERGPSDSTTRLVLMTLSLHMDQAGDNAFPSQRTLARRSALSERCVRQHLAIAERSGWLNVLARQPKGRGWRLHEYVATVPADLEDELLEHPWEVDPEWQREEPDA